MKFGMQLHQERGADAVLAEAKLADEQGFDTVWLWDHLINLTEPQIPDGPLDQFTLMTAVGTVTKNVRLAWATLTPGFRNAAMMVKMLATLDVITHGRVIASIGAGWKEEEYDAYHLEFQKDHDERIQAEREWVQLYQLLCSNPAPALSTFNGRWAKATNLPFSPAPVQKPWPTLWIGGDSKPTVDLVKEFANGWMVLAAGQKHILEPLLSAPDWPTRPMDIVRGARIYVADDRDTAVKFARAGYDLLKATSRNPVTYSFEEFVDREIVGTPDQCEARVREMESWGVTDLRVPFTTIEEQTLFAKLLMPRFERVLVA